MRSNRVLTTHSAPNLFRNGGFETGDTDFWEITGSGQEGFPALEVITVDEITNPDACYTFMKTVLPSTEPVSVEQNQGPQVGEYVDIEPEVSRFDIINGLTETDFGVIGCDLTIGVSMQVNGGAVGLFARFSVEDVLTSATDVVIIPMALNVSSSDWARYYAQYDINELTTALFDPKTKKITKIGLHAERREGSPEISLGKFQLIEGLYTVAPYTPCLFAMAFPKDAYLLSMGPEALPGFKDIYAGDKFFVMSGTPNSEGGARHHEHNITQRMSDHTNTANDDSWYIRAFLADKNIVSKSVEVDTELVLIDDGTLAHKHDIESPGGADTDNSTPLWRGYTICQKK